MKTPRPLRLALALGAVPCLLHAQELQRLSRADAVRAALERGARLGVARADSALAAARLFTARAFPNPAVSVSYSKDFPQYHLIAELPLDVPWIRYPRVASARAARAAAENRFAFERAAVELDAETTYTRALVALARQLISRRNAAASDSLRRMAIRRREAGDASDLDVELATVFAGQQANAAAADSLALIASLLDLQAVIGLTADRVTVLPSDSLVLPPDDSGSVAGTPLGVAAAEFALEAAELAVRYQRRSVLPLPVITFGFEALDPTGEEHGLLPTFGVGFALPLVNRSRGPIAQAVAERDRARAESELARLESRARIAEARRGRAIALAKVERDVRLLESAGRVAAMSLRAYQEGAASLPSVLEAQRNAREILAQYVDDLALAWDATSLLRALTLGAAAGDPR